MHTRIVLIDDHQILRQGLRTLLEKQPDMAVIAEADNGRAGIEFVRTLLPELVIMDVAMPDLNGIETTRQITAEIPGPKIIALSQHADRRFVLEMLRAGALGYLLKICAFEELLTAIKAVMANEAYLSPRIANVILTDYLHHLPKTDCSVYQVLTSREREVLQLIAEGKTNKDIAAVLTISVKTVDTHRQQIMSKLDMHNVAELIRFAIREGIVPLE